MKKLLIPCLLVAAAALSGCGPAQTKAPQAPGIAKVTVVQPKLMTVTNWDEYPAHLEAVEMVEIRPRVSGYVDSIHFTDGAEVKAGDLLFKIDPKPYQAELDRVQAQRQQAETHLELTKNDLKRAETLKATRAISDEEYDSRSKAVREAEAGLAVAKANETTAQINMDYTEIKAPISGRIGKRSVTPGNLVQVVGGTTSVLATIVSLDPIYSYFDANENAFLRYRKNANGAIPCQMAIGETGQYVCQGQVDFFDNQVNEKSGTIRMRAVFKNADHALVPGLFATVRVPEGPAAEALLIPDVTINSDQGHKFVMVVSETNTLAIRPVVVGRSIGTLRAVSGLTATDKVIVNGQMMMMPRPGTPVEIAPTSDSAQARN
jgi:RND family efflux transporter MFP subunit